MATVDTLTDEEIDRLYAQGRINAAEAIVAKSISDYRHPKETDEQHRQRMVDRNKIRKNLAALYNTYCAKLQLGPGRFYRSKNNEIWCCYRTRRTAPEHAKAVCINVETGETEYFYLDGRYDERGEREHTLVEEVPAP